MILKVAGINRFFLSSPNSNIVTGVELNRILDRDVLKKALEIVSQQHSVLKMLPTIDADNEGYLVFDPNYVTIIKEYQNISYEELAQQELPTILQLQKQALIHFVLLHRNKQTELILVSNHLIGDGIALNNLLEDIVKVLNGAVLPKGIPPKNLSEVSLAIKPSSKRNLLLKTINAIWKRKQSVLTQENINQAYTNYWSNRKPKLLIEELTIDETAAVIKHCKSTPYSVNSFLGTLFLYAHQIEQREKSVKNFIIPVNLRPYLSKTIKRSMGSYVSSIRFDLPEHYTTPIGDYATLLQKKIATWFQSSAMFNLLTLEQVHPNLFDAANLNKYNVQQDWLVQKLIKYFDLTKVNTQFILNNYGILSPPTKQVYTIENYLPVVISSAMTIEKYISIYTYAGKMRIGICYDACVVKTSTIQAYLKHFRSLLQQQITL